MPSTIKVEIKRQSNPDAPATTEKFEIPYRPGMNITSLLGEIALNPVDVSGQRHHAHHLRLQLPRRDLRLLRHAHQRQSRHGLLRPRRQTHRPQ